MAGKKIDIFAPTPIDEIAGIVAGARAAFVKGKTRPISWRKDQLKRIVRMMEENHDAIVAACLADLRKPEFEGSIMEVCFLIPVLCLIYSISEVTY